MDAAVREGPQGRVGLALDSSEILYELAHRLLEIDSAVHVRFPIALYERTIGINFYQRISERIAVFSEQRLKLRDPLAVLRIVALPPKSSINGRSLEQHSLQTRRYLGVRETG